MSTFRAEVKDDTAANFIKQSPVGVRRCRHSHTRKCIRFVVITKRAKAMRSNVNHADRVRPTRAYALARPKAPLPQCGSRTVPALICFMCTLEYFVPSLLLEELRI